MNPEAVSISENITLNINFGSIDLSVFDIISVLETSGLLVGVLRQDGIEIVSGKTYRLRFSADIPSGRLKVFQGSKLIYDATNTLFTEQVTISEAVSVFITAWREFVFDTAIVTESVSIALDHFERSLSDTISVSEGVFVFVPGFADEFIFVSESPTVIVIVRTNVFDLVTVTDLPTYPDDTVYIYDIPTIIIV